MGIPNLGDPPFSKLSLANAAIHTIADQRKQPQCQSDPTGATNFKKSKGSNSGGIALLAGSTNIKPAVVDPHATTTPDLLRRKG